MKINILRIIIFGAVFNFLQTHTMENQQLALQAQQHAYQSLYQLNNNQPFTMIGSTYISNSSNNTINGTTYNSTTKPLTKSNNQMESEEKFTLVTLEPYTVMKPTIVVDDDNRIAPDTILPIPDKESPLINMLTQQEDNVSLHCCNRHIICAKSTAAKIGCAVCSVGSIFVGLFVVLTLMYKGII